MLYSYQKATDRVPSPGKTIPRHLRILPTLISSLGLGMVASVVWPIGSYQLSLLLSRQEVSSSLLSPITYEAFGSETAGQSDSGPTLVADIDYTKASNWFTFSPVDGQPPVIPGRESQFIDLTGEPGSRLPPETVADEYILAIPSLGIKQAKVRSDTDDLAKSLIQYQKTSFPGEAGAPVIFGHSTLPQFFNADNYLTIFSTLPTIKIGADIFIDYAGVKYIYRVSRMYEVKPNDVWVLKQDYNQKTLKLITCVPPGTKLRRLVVEAELIKT